MEDATPMSDAASESTEQFDGDGSENYAPSNEISRDRYMDITTTLFNHRLHLALDTMDFPMSEHVFYSHIKQVRTSSLHKKRVPS